MLVIGKDDNKTYEVYDVSYDHSGYPKFLIYKGKQRWTIRDDDLESLVFTSSDACSGCSNNPKNGGSGICHCILGQTPITC